MRLVEEDAAPFDAVDAIHVDEVGIETGRWRDYFIKTTYRPLYARIDGMLRPVAVEAGIRPLTDGKPRTKAELFSRAGHDRARLLALCLALGVRNHANIGHDLMRLVVDCRAGTRRDAGVLERLIEDMPRHFEHTSLDAGMVTCIVADTAGAGGEAAFLLSRAARRTGFGVAIADFGAGPDAPALIEAVSPDLVFLDPGLLGAMRAVPQGLGLLRALVEALHAGGMEVGTRAIVAHDEMEAALGARLDLLGGPHLGAARLAGMPLEHDAIDPRGFVRAADNVIILRR